MSYNVFKEVNVGELFIDAPTAGDDAGHGGYKTPHVLFQKINTRAAKSLRTGHISKFTTKHEVIRIALNALELEIYPQ